MGKSGNPEKAGLKEPRSHSMMRVIRLILMKSVNLVYLSFVAVIFALYQIMSFGLFIFCFIFLWLICPSVHQSLKIVCL